MGTVTAHKRLRISGQVVAYRVLIGPFSSESKAWGNRLAASCREASCSTKKLRHANPRGRAIFPRKPWEEALSAAEIEDFRFHDLRHSAASYLAMSGATLAEIAEVLGHKTLAMVKRYSHLTEQHTSKVVARMNERFLS